MQLAVSLEEIIKNSKLGGIVTKYSMKTDKGIVRATNQDSCFVTIFDDGSCFAVVCDGMGGPNAGDVASEIAVKNISERFVAGWRPKITVESVKNLLSTSISAANICVYDAAEADEKYRGMGTTVVAAVLMDEILVIAHVGDSRAYLISDHIQLLTKDHSLVQELVDSGQITDSDAKNYPYRNVITRAIGISEHVDIDFSERRVEASDKIMLCSDGLTNFISEKDIYKIISDNDIDVVSDILVNTANSNGGGDNITAVVFAK